MKTVNNAQCYLALALLDILGVYCLGYWVARGTVLHAIEYYPEGKGGPRQDYVTKRGHPPGEGWEYQLFLPVIRLEESLKRL